MDCNGLYLTFTDCTRLFWTILDFTGLYWTILDSTGLYWTLLDYTYYTGKDFNKSVTIRQTGIHSDRQTA